jgi:hypothetical protein
MNHLPFIAASYAIAILVPLAFGLMAAHRVRLAKLRLRALETRPRDANRGGL